MIIMLSTEDSKFDSMKHICGVVAIMLSTEDSKHILFIRNSVMMICSQKTASLIH